MDWNLRTVDLNPYAPLWLKVLPLVLVVLLAIGFVSERPWDKPACATPRQTTQAQCSDSVPTSDVSTPTRPH